MLAIGRHGHSISVKIRDQKFPSITSLSATLHSVYKDGIFPTTQTKTTDITQYHNTKMLIQLEYRGQFKFN